MNDTQAKANDSTGSQLTNSGSGGGGGGDRHIRVTPDVATNSLLVFANRTDYRLVERTIREMDRPPVQVDVEVTIAEVTLTDNLSYGVQVYLNSGTVAGQFTNTSLNNPSSGIPLTTTNPALNLLVGAVANPRLVINALQAITTVKILSAPSLVVVDRAPAVLQVGSQVPILTQQATSTQTANAAVVNSVDYKDTGIILSVVPRVNANGMVSLDVDQQISAVTSTDTTTLTPTFSQRRVKSSISVANGQAVLLAGLITDQHNTGENGLPGLNQLTFLHDLLTSKNNTGTRTELIIFIRPQIIKNSLDAEQVSEEFRERLRSMERPRVIKP